MKRKIILASHGAMAEGMADTVKMVLGDWAGDIAAYRLEPGQNAIQFAEEVKSQIEKDGECEFVILTDLYQASVCTAMCSLVQYPNVYVFAGMNLNLLIALCTDYRQKLHESDIETLISISREGIRYIRQESMNVQGDEF